MARIEKLIEKLLSQPNDFTWEELIKVLNYYGYQEIKTGKTGGSRRKFFDKENNIINLHKPHPKKILKHYQIKQIVSDLKEKGKLQDE